MTTLAKTIAAERQLDWLLGEVLGNSTAAGLRAPASARTRAWTPRQWLAAALVLATATGVALLQRHRAATNADQPQEEAPLEWTEAHGRAGLAAVPQTVRHLRCFDFDGAAMAELGKFAQLERLDLSGMDVNAEGYAKAPSITDADLERLGTLTGLRWLSLAHCEQIRGPGLARLANLPRLEHLDLTGTQVDSAALARLPNLPTLRELGLSYCTKFHGRALADVAKIPGLRRLELQGCTTVRAEDLLHLATLHELSYLDVRDCQGRFRGQTMSFGAPVPDDAPKEDDIGITDQSLAALVGLPLHTLLLGGCETLTDALGDTLVQLPRLRVLDLSNLPKITGTLLRRLPRDLTMLRLDDSVGVDGAALQQLPALPTLVSLGLSGLALRDEEVAAVIGSHPVLVLQLGGEAPSLANAMRDRRQPELGPRTAAALATHTRLQRLDLSHHTGIAAPQLASIAALPALQHLQLTLANVTPELLRPLANCRSLTALMLRFSKPFDAAALQELASIPLRELDLYGTQLAPDRIKSAAAAWPGCHVTLADGQRFRVMTKPQ